MPDFIIPSVVPDKNFLLFKQTAHSVFDDTWLILMFAQKSCSKLFCAEKVKSLYKVKILIVYLNYDFKRR